MEQRSEVGQALNKLQAVREQNSRLALMSKPVPIKKGGFSAGCKNAEAKMPAGWRMLFCYDEQLCSNARAFRGVSETAYLAVNLV